MKKILLVHASGLTAEEACRGDVAANLSDLIAEGTFADLEGSIDLPSIIGSLPGDKVTVIAIPFQDIGAFDERVGQLRKRDPEAIIVILSEKVFISQYAFPELKVGQAVDAASIPALLSGAVV